MKAEGKDLRAAEQAVAVWEQWAERRLMDSDGDEVAADLLADVLHVLDKYVSDIDRVTERSWERYTSEVLAGGSEGSEVCSGEHCDGQGRTLEAGDDCAFCQEVEYGIWLAGEPD